jgi:Leucine-rich repeat (LRR) protein
MSTLCSSSLGSRGSEDHSTGAHSNTSPSQPVSTFLFGTEPYLDEQLKNDGGVCRKVRASHLLTSRSEGEQQFANDSGHVQWASLPHNALWKILKQLQWERKTSGAFRSVCKEWQEAHDSMVPSLRLMVPSQLPYRLHTKTGFAVVKEVDLSSLCRDPGKIVESAIASLSGLRSLNLANTTFEDLRWTTLRAAVSALTYLNMAETNVNDEQLARVSPFLPSLTHLDLQGCAQVTLDPYSLIYRPNFLSSLKALTRLELSNTDVGDEGIKALAPLTALTHLDLRNSAVSHQGLQSLAPLAAHLTHLVLGGEGEYGDPDLVAVSSLTALTRLEMLYVGEVEGATEEGLRALSSLTGLVHLEMDLVFFDNSDASWRSFSSLTAISRLHLVLHFFSEPVARALTCLPALTYLDLGDENGNYDRHIPNFLVSNESARALASLVRLTYLDLSGFQLNDYGVGALGSLTSLTYLDLSRLKSVRPISGDAVVALLGCLPLLSLLHLLDANMSAEAVSVLKNPTNEPLETRSINQAATLQVLLAGSTAGSTYISSFNRPQG